MMKTAHPPEFNDLGLFPRLRGSTAWRVLMQRQVCSGRVRVVDVVGEYLFQMRASQNDHVIEALSTNGSYDALRVWTLPGRAGRRGHFLNAECSDLATKSRAVDEQEGLL